MESIRFKLVFMYQKPTWSLVSPSLGIEWVGAASLSSLNLVWNTHWHLTGSWTTRQDLRSLSSQADKSSRHNFYSYARNLFLVTIRSLMSMYTACLLTAYSGSIGSWLSGYHLGIPAWKATHFEHNIHTNIYGLKFTCAPRWYRDVWLALR